MKGKGKSASKQKGENDDSFMGFRETKGKSAGKHKGENDDSFMGSFMGLLETKGKSAGKHKGECVDSFKGSMEGKGKSAGKRKGENDDSVKGSMEGKGKSAGKHKGENDDSVKGSMEGKGKSAGKQKGEYDSTKGKGKTKSSDQSAVETPPRSCLKREPPDSAEPSLRRRVSFSETSTSSPQGRGPVAQGLCRAVVATVMVPELSLTGSSSTKENTRHLA